MTRLRSSLPALAVLGLGILFMALGVLRGEVFTVWNKAIYICLECIGIG